MDVSIIRLVVCGLIALCAISLVGSIILVAIDKPIPVGVASIGSTSIGMLVGLLVVPGRNVKSRY